MKLPAFISDLLPSFGKDRITEDIRITRTELKEFTEPPYAVAAVLLKGWKFKSEVLVDKFDIFKRQVKSAGGDNPIVTIHKSFKDILENLDCVEELIVKTYNDDVAGNGLTYLKANLLQFVEAVSFVSKYARKFLIYVYVCETAEYPDSGTALNDSLSPAEIEWLNANFLSFCTALNVVSGNPQQVKKQIDNIPDIIITSENATTLPSTMGEARLDPFQMNLITVRMNPIYHIRMFVAEYQADRYKAAKEEVKLLQLRKLNLEKLADGKPEAHIQKEITYMETRIQGLNFKIAKMEKENA